jgi:hypothetical protein
MAAILSVVSGQLLGVLNFSGFFEVLNISILLAMYQAHSVDAMLWRHLVCEVATGLASVVRV